MMMPVSITDMQLLVPFLQAHLGHLDLVFTNAGDEDASHLIHDMMYHAQVFLHSFSCLYDNQHLHTVAPNHPLHPNFCILQEYLEHSKAIMTKYEAIRPYVIGLVNSPNQSEAIDALVCDKLSEMLISDIAKLESHTSDLSIRLQDANETMKINNDSNN